MKLENGKFLGENRWTYDAGGLIVTETEYRRKVFEGWHSHDNFHLTLIVRGGNRERRRRRSKDFEASPGSLLFYRRGELHRNGATRHPSKNINLEITDAFLTAYQASVPAFDSSPLDSAADAKFSLLKIYKECRDSDAQTTASVHSLVLAMLDSTLAEKTSGKIPPSIKSLRESSTTAGMKRCRWRNFPQFSKFIRSRFPKNFRSFFPARSANTREKSKSRKPSL